MIKVGNEDAVRLRILRVCRNAFPPAVQPLFELLDAADPQVAEVAAAVLSQWLPSPDEMLQQLNALDAVDADLARILTEHGQKPLA